MDLAEVSVYILITEAITLPRYSPLGALHLSFEGGVGSRFKGKYSSNRLNLNALEDIELFLKQKLLQWIKLDQSSRPWKELLSKVRNQTPYLPSLPQHTNTHRSLCDILGQPPLSSAEASLYCGEAGRKKKRAREARWEGERPFPSSHRPPRAFYFFDYCYFDGDTQREPLRRREVSRYIIFKLY